MITIEQLLESVDLDFEPRWVTKDEDGCIKFFSDTPREFRDQWICDHEAKVQSIYPIKISDFANKKWQECIYEVPRKTTTNSKKELVGNIEKLNLLNDSALLWGKKINELVDAVNKHADIIQQIGDWGSRKGECLWCEKLTSVNLGK